MARSFNIIGSLLLALSAQAAVAQSAEKITPGNYQYHALHYATGSEVLTCGVRMVAVNKRGVALEVTFSISIGPDKEPAGVLRAAATQGARIDGKVVMKPLYVNHAWVRTVRGTRVKEVQRDRADDRNALLIATSDIDNMFALMEQLTLGRVRIAFNEKQGAPDRVYELTDPPAPETVNKLSACMTGLIHTIKRLGP